MRYHSPPFKTEYCLKLPGLTFVSNVQAVTPSKECSTRQWSGFAPGQDHEMSSMTGESPTKTGAVT